MTKMVVVVVDVEVVVVICQKNNKKLKIKIRKQTYVGSISSTNIYSHYKIRPDRA